MAKPNPALVDKLLAVAQERFLAQGFAATTIDQVCQDAQVTKGTLFHYYRSKDALIRATLERFLRRGMEAGQAAGFTQLADPMARFDGYIAFMIESVRDPIRDACLIGMCSAELADSQPDLRALCAQAFAGWAAGLRGILAEVKRRHAPRAKADPQALAEHFIAVFEGALLLAKARGTAAPVQAGLRHYQLYVKSVLGG